MSLRDSQQDYDPAHAPGRKLPHGRDDILPGSGPRTGKPPPGPESLRWGALWKEDRVDAIIAAIVILSLCLGGGLLAILVGIAVRISQP